MLKDAIKFNNLKVEQIYEREYPEWLHWDKNDNDISTI